MSFSFFSTKGDNPHWGAPVTRHCWFIHIRFGPLQCAASPEDCASTECPNAQRNPNERALPCMARFPHIEWPCFFILCLSMQRNFIVASLIDGMLEPHRDKRTQRGLSTS